MDEERAQIGFGSACTVYLLLLAGALGWFAATLLPAYWAGHGEPLWAAFAHHCFHPVCHQIAARSFYLWGHPLAVCARCSGIYFGFIVGLLVYPWLRSLPESRLPARSYLAVALVPTALDFLLGYAHIVSNTHLSRSVTGAIAGGALAFYLLPAAISLVQECASAPPLRAVRALKEFSLWKQQAR